MEKVVGFVVDFLNSSFEVERRFILGAFLW